MIRVTVPLKGCGGGSVGDTHVPGTVEVPHNTLCSSNVGLARGMDKSTQHTNCMGQVRPGAVDKVEEGAHNFHVGKYGLRDNSVEFIQGCFSEFNVGV
jgi:hypothetical protein